MLEEYKHQLTTNVRTLNPAVLTHKVKIHNQPIFFMNCTDGGTYTQPHTQLPHGKSFMWKAWV